MESKLSPFDILSISQNSSNHEIRERYLLMSRTFHPDKQPLEHWNLTKQYFEKIDKAYKSISTELRKYVYSKLGVDGIDLMERFPEEFTLLEGKEATMEGKQEIDEIIFNLHFSDRRDYLDDQGKVDSTVVIDLSDVFKKPIEGFPPVNYSLPSVVKVNSYYTASAPSFLNFQNNVIFEFSSHAKKAQIGTGLLSTRRIFNNFLLKNMVAYGGSGGFFNSCSIEYLHSPTFSIKTVPLVYAEGSFMRPKIEFEKRFQSEINISANTNGEDHNANIYFPGSTKESTHKNIQLSFKDHVQVEAELNFHVSSFCRFIVSMNSVFQYATTRLGVSYGIVATLTEDTSVSLLSHLHSESSFEIRISSGKYNFKIPIICSTLPVEQFQLLKLGAIVGFYFGCKMLHYYRRNSSMKREKLRLKSFARLNEDESKLKIILSDIQLQEMEITRFQTLSHGLVIQAAYVGNERAINRIASRVKRAYNNLIHGSLEQLRAQLEFQSEEVINATKLVQVLVKGARIQNELLKTYNPCYDQTQTPTLFICYSLRGSTHYITQSVTKPINIGLAAKPRDNLLTNILTWLRKVNIIL